MTQCSFEIETGTATFDHSFEAQPPGLLPFEVEEAGFLKVRDDRLHRPHIESKAHKMLAKNCITKIFAEVIIDLLIWKRVLFSEHEFSAANDISEMFNDCALDNHSSLVLAKFQLHKLLWAERTRYPSFHIQQTGSHQYHCYKPGKHLSIHSTRLKAKNTFQTKINVIEPQK